MDNILDIGPAPDGENPVQVGTDNYYAKAYAECRVFIRQLRRVFGEEPPGARLVVRNNRHDYGQYCEAAVKYDENEKAAVEYAFRIEAESPYNWDDEARAERNLATLGEEHAKG